MGMALSALVRMEAGPADSPTENGTCLASDRLRQQT